MALFTDLVGVVFGDTDDSGKQDGAEQPIAGVTVNLYSNDNLIPDPGGADGAPIQTVTTNAQGEFSFTSVARGYYYYEVEFPSGFNGSSSIRVADPLGNTTNDQGLSSIIMVITNGSAFVRGLVVDNFMIGDPDFYDYQYYEGPAGWGTPSVILGDSEAIIGTERDVELSFSVIGGTTTTLLIGGGSAGLTVPSGTTVDAIIIWDGVGTPTEGLGGIDLTRGGFDDHILQEIIETDQNTTLTITLKDTSGNTVSTDITISNVPGTDLAYIPFSLFEPTVDTTSIASITWSLAGTPTLGASLGSITTGHTAQGFSAGLVLRDSPSPVPPPQESWPVPVIPRQKPTTQFIGELSGTVTFTDGTEDYFSATLDDMGNIATSSSDNNQVILELQSSTNWLQEVFAMVSNTLALNPLGTPIRVVNSAAIRFFGRASRIDGTVGDFTVGFDNELGAYVVSGDVSVYGEFSSDDIITWLGTLVGESQVTT